MGICVCRVRARHAVTVTEAIQWRLVEAPTRGRKRAFDAIDPDEVFDRRALLEEDRQCDILHRQAKRDAKRQQQRLKKGPLKSIPEQGDADGEEAGGDLVTSRGGQPVAASPTRRPACVAASLWRPACSRQL